MFSMTPKLDANALQRFRDSPLKKIQIKVASPTKLRNVDAPMQAVATSFSQLGQAYEAPIITLEMSMGHNKGGLGQATKLMAEGFLTLIGMNDDVDVRTIKAMSEDIDGNEPINLIDQVLSVKEDIVLRSNNPDDIYDDCLSHLKIVLDYHA